MKKTFLIALGLIVTATNIKAIEYDANAKRSSNRVYVDDYNRNGKRGSQKEVHVSHEHPFDPKSGNPDWVQTDTFELETDPKLYQEVMRRKKRFEDALDGTLDISVLQAPVCKVLKNVDTLYLHPSYTTTVLLPERYAIVSAYPSFGTNVFEYGKNSNMLIIRPKFGFRNGNIVLTYTDGKKNGYITIYVKQYMNNTRCENVAGNYKCADEYFSTNYTYYEQKPLSTKDKITIVNYLKRQNPGIDFNREHRVVYRGVVYYVKATPDGSLFYNNLRLSFSTSRYQY